MSDQTNEASKFLPSLEQAINRKYFFLLATYTLLVDSTLIKIQGIGLLHYAQNPEGLKSSFALAVFLLFVLFSFLMALVAPMVSEFMNAIVLGWISPLWDRLITWLDHQFGVQKNINDDIYRTPFGYVSISALRQKAHASRGEAYYFSLLRFEEDKEYLADKDQYATRFAASAALLAAIYNFCFLHSQSLLNRGTDFLGSGFYGWFFLILIAGNAFGFLFETYKTRWVYCPSLWKELNDAKHKIM